MGEKSSAPRGKTNPRKEANILSVITFFYNYPLLKKGKKRDLENEDIYEVLPKFNAEKLGNRLERQWKNDRAHGGKLWISLVKGFGITYFFYTLIQLCFSTFIVLYQPEIFSKFVSYFKPNQTTTSTIQAYSYGASMGGFMLLNAFFLHNFSQLVIEYSLKIRTAVTSLIFRKSLRITPKAFLKISVGKTMTILTKDVFTIEGALWFMKDMLIGFLQLIVVTCILYRRVGKAAFLPIFIIVVIIPSQVICGKIISKMRLGMAKLTDERLTRTQETLSAIKIIKMFTWQKYFEAIIGKVRRKEIKKLVIVYYLKAFIGWLGAFTTNIALYIFMITYISMGNAVQPEIVYFVQQCLFTLKTAVMVSIPMGIGSIADLRAAFERIQSFLDAEEVQPSAISIDEQPKITLQNVKVALAQQTILDSVSLTIHQGLLVVTGNIASGKTTLLKTIAKELSIESGILDVKGTISYAPEQPWIFPGTIRENIIFGEEFDQKRYLRVLKSCALFHDLTALKNSDETIIGDNGFNISKGQQARISLARAVYRECDIYLLDDCLSHLDYNVSEHIFQQCIQGLLKDKICIFVNNSVQFIRQVMPHDIVFLENGRIVKLEQREGEFDSQLVINDEVDGITKMIKDDNEDLIDTNWDEEYGKLLTKNDDALKTDIYHEDKKSGKVVWAHYKTYYKLMGGFFIFAYLFVAFAASQTSLSYSEKIISQWTDTERTLATYISSNQTNSTEFLQSMDSRNHYLSLYTYLIIAAMVLTITRAYSTLILCLNAAKSAHNQLLIAILNAYMSFFDKHYIGNIINRLSKDLFVIDEFMPFLIYDMLRLTFNFAGVIFLIASVNWSLFIPAIFLVIKLYIIQRLYLPTGRSLSRLEAASKSPMMGYVNSTLQGVSIIRTSKKMELVTKRFDSYQDFFTSAYYMNETTTRFFGLLLDIFGSFFVVGICFKFLLFTGGESQGEVGLALSQSMMLSGILQYAIKQSAKLETVMTSMERVLEYTNAKEEKTNLEKKPNDDWPKTGRISINNVSLSYRESVAVLKNLNVEILAGEKIGIVGRTGAGKSSITLALFRLYNFEGTITIDDQDINDINLDILRSSLTIIPQDPVLFSGTVRSNLDPFNKYSDDNKLWQALELVHLNRVISDLDKDIFKIPFSNGQKQLFCLARALIQNNKIIVLDEATSNLDPETDLLLQRTIKQIFQNCTVLIIAHKLYSVMWCDKIITLKDGEVVDYDTPKSLLEKQGSILKKMTGDDNFETFLTLTHII